MLAVAIKYGGTYSPLMLSSGDGSSFATSSGDDATTSTERTPVNVLVYAMFLLIFCCEAKMLRQVSPETPGSSLFLTMVFEIVFQPILS